MNQGNEGSLPSGSANMASNMPNVPKVECDAPAVYRVEIFTPLDGRAHGKLDSVQYLCAKHEANFAEVLGWDSGGDITAHRSELAHSDIHCGEGWDFVIGAPVEPFTADFAPTSNEQVLEAFKVGKTVGERSVEAYQKLVDQELGKAVERIGDKLAELQELKAQHAFTVAPDETEIDTWHWSCRCGNFDAVQLPPWEEQVPIGMRLVAHVQEVEL